MSWNQAVAKFEAEARRLYWGAVSDAETHDLIQAQRDLVTRLASSNPTYRATNVRQLRVINTELHTRYHLMQSLTDLLAPFALPET